MPDDQPRKKLGREGEKTAAAILQRAGYRILARNWRFGHLEIDIVCELGELIVFVEVKTRRSSGRGGPAGAISENKKRYLALAARAWLYANGAWFRPCRFDVVCLVGNGREFRMEHYPNAFEPGEAVDSCHAYWQ